MGDPEIIVPEPVIPVLFGFYRAHRISAGQQKNSDR
jgi:hypothetical protein